jgi:4-amino-4-deoxy-L-arabinose transferase-like glycosyltransferase
MKQFFKNKPRIQILVPWTLLACLMAGLIYMNLRRDCWNDECHFIETIRLFIAQPTLSTLAGYNEMSTPLPFILYALWGRIFGDSLVALRLFSLIITAVTYFSFYRLFESIFSDRRKAAWLTLFLAINPYMAGASVFVYTDMLTMFFLYVFCLALKNRSPLLVCIGAACGLLCRQFFVFIVVAAFCWCFVSYIQRKERRELVMTGALVLGALPLCACFLLWQGFCPSNFFKTRYISHAMSFHPNSVTMYATQIIIYLLPVICLRIKSLYANRARLMAAALTCWIYWLIPVAGSPAAKIKTDTIGFFHRLLRVWPGERREQWVFFICFALALPVLFSILSDARQRIKSKDGSFPLFIDFSIIAFFLVMPFSYMHWEKYFLPLVPLMAIQFLLPYGKNEKSKTPPEPQPLSAHQA